MRQFIFMVAMACFFLSPLHTGCDSPVKPKETSETGVSTQSELTGEPEFITVQHILIGFSTPNKGRPGTGSSVPGKSISRTKQESEVLANELLKRATDGEDFGELVKQYTNDSPPGIYQMANFGQDNVPAGVYKRSDMVPAFGNVGFPLPSGGVGLAVYDPDTSPYGWHVIKRIK